MPVILAHRKLRQEDRILKLACFFVCLFLFFVALSLTLARKTLYHLSHSTSSLGDIIKPCLKNKESPSLVHFSTIYYPLVKGINIRV
jgi:hypothetical protein